MTVSHMSRNVLLCSAATARIASRKNYERLWVNGRWRLHAPNLERFCRIQGDAQIGCADSAHSAAACVQIQRGKVCTRRGTRSSRQSGAWDEHESISGSLDAPLLEPLTDLGMPPGRVRICVDLGYQADSDKALFSIGKQLQMMVAANRRSRHPAELHVSDFHGAVKEATERKHPIEKWEITTHECSVVDAFPIGTRFVYLSPDGASVIAGQVSPEVVYVIGGLVDVNPPTPQLSRRRADSLGLNSVYLPVRATFPDSALRALNIDQAVATVLMRQEVDSWEEALRGSVPFRIQEGRKMRLRKHHAAEAFASPRDN